ncbi:MAG: hypothetical protein WC340_00550 [Kiritimatiellia bacterium]
MPVNLDKPHLWKADSLKSIDFYNDWFLRFAPATYRQQRRLRTQDVIDALELTDHLQSLSPELLKESERFRRQKAVDASKSSLARNQLGQFSTPFSLACRIASFTAGLNKSGQY